MSSTLVLASLRQRLTSPMRMTLALLAGFFGVAIGVGMHTLATLEGLAGTLALIFSAGAIGQDLASGVLQLTFSRPQTRRGYVLSRWMAAVGAAWGMHTLYVLVTAAGLAARGASPSPAAVLILMLEAGAVIIATCAVIVGFSSLVRGFGDLGLFAATMFVSATGAQVARARGLGWLERLFQELGHTIQPELKLGFLMRGGDVPWDGLATWALTIPLFLALAIAVMNNREISYGDG